MPPVFATRNARRDHYEGKPGWVRGSRRCMRYYFACSSRSPINVKWDGGREEGEGGGHTHAHPEQDTTIIDPFDKPCNGGSSGSKRLSIRDIALRDTKEHVHGTSNETDNVLTRDKSMQQLFPHQLRQRRLLHLTRIPTPLHPRP